MFPLKSITRQGDYFTITIHCIFGHYIFVSVVDRDIKQERGIKTIQIKKEEVKLSLFANGVILYTGELKHSTKKLLEYMGEFGKVASYKINT